MTVAERLEGCILGGAIGDAWGSGFENQFELEDDTFYLVGNPYVKMPCWNITDDTQFTLATIEAIVENKEANPKYIADSFLKYYKQRTLRGLGASTLKALRELEVGGHWSQVGRRGEYAAGNGAAMRIAPLAFLENITDSNIKDICSITHHNDEAYVGAKSVMIAIKEILNDNWIGEDNLISKILPKIPDTRIRDRLIEVQDIKELIDVAAFGKDAYVVNSVPLAISAANKVKEIGVEEVFSQLISIGGDTDTNCSIAGQIMGTLVGRKGIPKHLINKLQSLESYKWIETSIENYKQQLA
jgi:ADP-ribosylglycohydrolase